MEYDAQIIVSFAASLYDKAQSIIMRYTILGALVGLAAGATTHEGIIAIIVGALGAYIGYSLGSDKAFQLRLQAQIALCQVQIEKNTRRNN